VSDGHGPVPFDPYGVYPARVELPWSVWAQVLLLARATSQTPGQVVEGAVLRRLNGLTAAEVRAMRRPVDRELPAGSPRMGRSQQPRGTSV
jgi:hypothetical protein